MKNEFNVNLTDTRKKIRILCVAAHQLGRNAFSWRVLNVAHALHSHGYDVRVMEYLRRRPSTPSHVSFEEMSAVPREIVVSSRLSCFIRHLRLVSHGRYDLVIANNTSAALYCTLGLLRSPLILDMHGDMVAELSLEQADVRPIKYWTRRAIYRMADKTTLSFSNRIACVSRRMMAVLRQRGVSEEKLFYAPNGVNLDFFRPQTAATSQLRKELGIGREKLLFGYVGRFQPWQGIENFVEAARRCNHPAAEFLIVGARKTTQEGTLHFMSEVAIREVPNCYAICDVLVLPRPSHPATEVAAPTKFAEYSAMGKPILTTNVGDAADLVRRFGCGVVVEDNTVDELQRGIARMAELGPEALLGMGRSARRLAEEEFDFEITKRNYIRCVEDVTSHNRS